MPSDDALRLAALLRDPAVREELKDTIAEAVAEVLEAERQSATQAKARAYVEEQLATPKRKGSERKKRGK